MQFLFGIIQFVAVFHLSVYYLFLIIGGDEQGDFGQGGVVAVPAGFLLRFVRIVEEKKTLFYFYQYPQQDSVSHIGVEYNEQEDEEEDFKGVLWLCSPMRTDGLFLIHMQFVTHRIPHFLLNEGGRKQFPPGRTD